MPDSSQSHTAPGRGAPLPTDYTTHLGMGGTPSLRVLIATLTSMEHLPSIFLYIIFVAIYCIYDAYIK